VVGPSSAAGGFDRVPAALESHLAGAALLEIELDARFRVLAVTSEPQPDRPIGAQDGAAEHVRAVPA
jgi:hypothetical protein